MNSLAPGTSVSYPRGFLFRTAANLAIDHLRQGRVGRQTGEALEAAAGVPSAVPSAERAVFDKPRLHIFLRAIDRLSPCSREAFLLQAGPRLFLP
jgi:RNA polymerase sigma-70 factor (ECF subfamily)